MTSERYLATCCRSRQRRSSRRASAPCPDPCLGSPRAHSAWPPVRGPITTRLQPVDAFDERADVLWKKHSAHPPRDRPANLRRPRMALRHRGTCVSLPTLLLVARARADRLPRASRAPTGMGLPALRMRRLPRSAEHGWCPPRALHRTRAPGEHRYDRAADSDISPRGQRIRSLGFQLSTPRPPASFMVAIDPTDPSHDAVTSLGNWFITSADGDEEVSSRNNAL